MPRSIQLDNEAWTILQRARQKDESWSDLIRRCVRPKPSLAEVLKKLHEATPSDETLNAADESLNRRRQTRKPTPARRKSS
jgi:predicted CopG family antitoxin